MNTRQRFQDDRNSRFDFIEGNTQYERERAAENSGLANGIVLGSIIVASLSIAIAVWAYANREFSPQPQPKTINPVTVPALLNPNADAQRF
jgi:hypothetical protein